MGTGRIAALVGILVFGQALAAEQTPEERYNEAEKSLTPCEYCQGINGTPRDIAALEAMWQATQDWTVERLNAGRSVDRFRTDLLNLNSARFGVAPTSIEAIGPGLYGVTSGALDSTGTAFIVGKKNGRFAVLWNIRRLSEKDKVQFPLLKAWSSKSARQTCRQETEDKHWRECGPLSGSFLRLPPDSHGHRRFAIDATYAQPAETTVGAQLTIWTWNGQSGNPVWARLYGWNFEDVSQKLDGDLLKIRSTQFWRMFFTCGTCVGRQMDWTIRIGPDRVDDLGAIPVIPELDAIDELFYRVWKHEPASDLATPEVLITVDKIITERQDEDLRIANEHHEKVDMNFLTLGMLGGEFRAKAMGNVICIDPDDSGLMLFRFETRRGTLFATELRQLAENEGGICPKSPP